MFYSTSRGYQSKVSVYEKSTLCLLLQLLPYGVQQSFIHLDIIMPTINCIKTPPTKWI